MSDENNISYNTDDFAAPQQVFGDTSDGEGGLIGFLINRGLASNKAEANRILLVIMALVLGATLWVNWGRIFPPHYAAPTPVQTLAPSGPSTPTTP